MINIHYNSKSSAYYAKLSKINKASKDTILMKFDTGAVNTVISIETIIESDNTEINKNIFINYLKDKNITARLFKSASGNEMTGYLCVAKNVNISGVIFDEFYYYLIVDVKQNIALLGDDFIACCNFSHSVNSDIHINAFDKNIYTEKHKKQSLSEDELSDILLASMETKSS